MHQELSRLFAENFSNAVVDADSPQMKMLDDVCRANLESNVRDPVLREKLRPNYRAACKRLIISSDFYQAIQKPNAELVSEGIERIEAGGVRTRDGRLHELDVLVLATGFRVDRFLRPIEVLGSEGKRLETVWEKRPIAYLSISIPGFPNLFMLNGPNGPVGNFSLIEVAELQIAYILQLVAVAPHGPLPRDRPERGRDRGASTRRASRRRRRRCGPPAAAAGTSTIAASPPPGRGPSIASARRWRRRSSRPTSCATDLRGLIRRSRREKREATSDQGEAPRSRAAAERPRADPMVTSVRFH